jgi:hypothetical protein
MPLAGLGILDFCLKRKAVMDIGMPIPIITSVKNILKEN